MTFPYVDALSKELDLGYVLFRSNAIAFDRESLWRLKPSYIRARSATISRKLFRLLNNHLVRSDVPQPFAHSGSPS